MGGIQEKKPSERDGLSLELYSGQPDGGVEEAVEGFASSERRVRVDPLVDFGEGVEEAPGIPGFEVRVAGLAPFLKHVRNLAGGDRFAIDCSDDNVVGGPVGHRFAAVGFDALVEVTLGPKSPCVVMSVGGGPVVGVLVVAKDGVLRRDELPRVWSEPFPHDEALLAFPIPLGRFLDPLERSDALALQVSLARLGIDRLRREAVLHFQGVLHDPLEERSISAAIARVSYHRFDRAANPLVAIVTQHLPGNGVR